MEKILKYRVLIIGIVVGLTGGFLYHHFYGCNSGCGITSDPLRSTLYGGIMGGLLFSMFKK